MKPICVKRINEAAGRELSKSELDGIERNIKGALRELAAKDPVGFYGQDLNSRMVDAVKLAKEKMLADKTQAVENAIMDAGRMAQRTRELEAVKPGLKGRTHAVKLGLLSMENKVDAMCANFFRLVPEIGKGKFFGMIHDPNNTLEIGRALFGEQASPEVQAAAKGLEKALTALPERGKLAGLGGSALENYVPQPQDPIKLATAGKDAWVRDHLAEVDFGKMVGPEGELRTKEDMTRFLEKCYESISSDGANKRTMDPQERASRISSPNMRQIFYKDADSWFRMMQKYGRSTNIYDMVNTHVRRYASDIAWAEQYGRNADVNVTKLLAQAYIDDQVALQGNANGLKSLRDLSNQTQTIYDAMRYPDKPGRERAANICAQIRGLIGSTQLGSLVGAFPDLAGMKMACEYNGLPAMRAFRYFVDSMKPGAEKEDFLRKLGVWLDGFQHAANRSGVEEFKSGWGTFLNEATHRAMGLNTFDRGMRSGMGRVVMDTLGGLTRKLGTVAEAEGSTRMLQDFGVTQDHWNVWKAAELQDGLLTPDAIDAIPREKLESLVEQKRGVRLDAEVDRLRAEASEKLMETAYGVMQFGARGASRSTMADRLMLGIADPKTAGHLAGEVHRFMLQFKGVPLGIFRAHWDAMGNIDGYGSKIAYASKFVAYSTMLGALAVELKSIINGQNPRTMNPATEEGQKFWLEALASGGGMGIYGDLFANGQTKGGGGLEVLGGPGISAGWSIYKEAMLAKEAAINGETNHDFSLAGLRWVRKNATPFANLWYTKAAFNHMVYDQMQDALAPGSSARQQARMEAKGISYWWAPGEMAPTSAPDLSTAFRSQ
jgi:hypothetical protein